MPRVTTGPEPCCDVLVVGSGVAGLTAALTARAAGLDVMLIEKTGLFGGTSAHSEGMLWVPLSAQALAQDKADSIESAFRYLEAAAADRLDRGKTWAYLRAAPAMIRFVESASRVRYVLAGSLDYESELPGASAGVRSLAVQPIDGRALGPVFEQIRRPLPSTLAFGGMTLTATDLPCVLNAHRSPRAFAHMARLTLLYAFDRVRGYSRGTRIGHGHAVVAGLVEALVRRGATLMRNTAMRALDVEAGRVLGAFVADETGDYRIRARRGVILAAGGFSNDPRRKAALFDHVGRSHPHALLATEAATGDAIAAGVRAGGALATDLAQPAAWTPVSLVPRRDGSLMAFPHYLDRNKPGFIAVNRGGQRFTNEAASYHRFVAAMIASCRDEPATEAWLIADSRAVDRFGIGASPPFPLLLRRAARSGYLTKADALTALAPAIGVPEQALTATVERFNRFARSGIDEDFHRGETAYERASGDPAQRPNPSLGPLERGPFYAVRLVPSDIGTFAGLRTDASARVLDENGAAVAGLYAVGNDAANPFGGTYPAAGVTVGLAMTFGYVAGRHVAGEQGDTAAPISSMTPVT